MNYAYRNTLTLSRYGLFLMFAGISTVAGMTISVSQVSVSYAQTTTLTRPTPISAPTTPSANPLLSADIEQLPSTATESGLNASESAETASPAANIEAKLQERKERDITESTGVQKSKLATFLDENPIEPLSWNNFIQHGIRYAVSEGIPANVIVLIILFPLVAALIGASRHVIGLRGFGMYIPAVLSVALVSTGIMEGLLIFGAIVVAALGTKELLKKARIAYLPRTALLIWTISMGLLALFILIPFFNISSLIGVNIFPILILVLLAENFLDALLRTKPTDAMALTGETLGLAFISSLILQLESLQKFALLEPELLILAIAFFNILVGKFAGLRLAEFLRFRSIIEEE